MTNPLRHRKPQPERLTVRYGVTRAGSVGVAVYREGRQVGWGLNETAAMASVTITQ